MRDDLYPASSAFAATKSPVFDHYFKDVTSTASTKRPQGAVAPAAEMGPSNKAMTPTTSLAMVPRRFAPRNKQRCRLLSTKSILSPIALF
jgi:hypothetical protein